LPAFATRTDYHVGDSVPWQLDGITNAAVAVQESLP
jgi:hypothetical protein